MLSGLAVPSAAHSVVGKTWYSQRGVTRLLCWTGQEPGKVHFVKTCCGFGLKPVVNCWDKQSWFVWQGDFVVMTEKGPAHRALPYAEPHFSSGRTVGASSLSHPAAWHRWILSRICLDNSQLWREGANKLAPLALVLVETHKNATQSCCVAL